MCHVGTCLALKHGMTNILYLTSCVLVLGMASAAAAEAPLSRAPLTLALSAHVAPAPAQVTARIRVEPSTAARRLSVEWWQEDGAGGLHEVTLDGAAAARQDFVIKRMEAGTYLVRATLTRQDGSVVRKDSRVIVVGEGASLRLDGNGDLAADRSSAPRR